MGIYIFFTIIWLMIALVIQAGSFLDVDMNGFKFKNKKEAWLTWIAIWFWPVVLLYVMIRHILFWPLDSKIEDENER